VCFLHCQRGSKSGFWSMFWVNFNFIRFRFILRNFWNFFRMICGRWRTWNFFWSSSILGWGRVFFERFLYFQVFCCILKSPCLRGFLSCFLSIFFVFDCSFWLLSGVYSLFLCLYCGRRVHLRVQFLFQFIFRILVGIRRFFLDFFE